MDPKLIVTLGNTANSDPDQEGSELGSGSTFFFNLVGPDKIKARLFYYSTFFLMQLCMCTFCYKEITNFKQKIGKVLFIQDSDQGYVNE